MILKALLRASNNRFHGKFCVFYEGSDKHGRWRILKTKIEGF